MKRARTVVSIAFALAFAAGAASAQTPAADAAPLPAGTELPPSTPMASPPHAPPAGTWMGRLTLRGRDVGVLLRIADPPGSAETQLMFMQPLSCRLRAGSAGPGPDGAYVIGLRDSVGGFCDRLEGGFVTVQQADPQVLAVVIRAFNGAPVAQGPFTLR